MQPTLALGLLLLAASAAPAAGDATNPLAKVIDLMTDLEAKIQKDGEDEMNAYREYYEWCDDASKNLAFEIKTATAEQEKLEAAIEQATSDIEAGESKIEELAAAIASGEGDLKNATLIRDKEHEDFLAAEAELVESVDTLGRAIGILEREMAKNPALVQVNAANFQGLVQGLGAVIDAAALSGNDKRKLMSLVQAQASSEDSDSMEDEEESKMNGAPDPAAYKTHSTSIVEVLEDLKDKAETELSELRKAETNAQHNYAMLKQSLEDQAAADKKNLAEEQSAKKDAEEAKASAEGDLSVTVKALKDAKEDLVMTQNGCMQVAADHEVTMKSRAEELEAIATAKKILIDTSAGAVAQTYSLLQVAARSKMRTRADLAGSEVVTLVQSLAKKHHSSALAELASKISTVIKFGSTGGDDPFVKVKGLIKSLIDRLLAEAAAEAEEKAYCDEQMAKTEEKKSELEDDIAKLTAKLDEAAAKSATLKEEVKALQEELAALAKLQAEMDKTRADQHAAYAAAKSELEQGLAGVRAALDVLRSYYGEKEAEAAGEDVTALMQQPAKPEKHKPAGGAGQGIVGILEVVESDFAKNLAETETEESDAQMQYDKITQENKVTEAAKEADVKYKTQEFKALDKVISDLTSDKETASEELSSVLDYYEKIKERCVAKPETYEERKKRRDAEIAGLKEALAILEGEAAFVQRGHAGVLRR